MNEYACAFAQNVNKEHERHVLHHKSSKKLAEKRVERNKGKEKKSRAWNHTDAHAYASAYVYTMCINVYMVHEILKIFPLI